jgi:hypothetical protein
MESLVRTDVPFTGMGGTPSEVELQELQAQGEFYLPIPDVMRPDIPRQFTDVARGDGPMSDVEFQELQTQWDEAMKKTVPFPDIGEGTLTEQQKQDVIETTEAAARSEEQKQVSISRAALGLADTSGKDTIRQQEWGKTPGVGLYPFALEAGRSGDFMEYADMLFSMYNPEEEYRDDRLGGRYDLPDEHGIVSGGEAAKKYRDWMRGFFDSPNWVEGQERSEIDIAHDIVNDMREYEQGKGMKDHAMNFHPSLDEGMDTKGNSHRLNTLQRRLAQLGVPDDMREAILNVLPMAIIQLQSSGLSDADITERILQTTEQRMSGAQKGKLVAKGLNPDQTEYRGPERVPERDASGWLHPDPEANAYAQSIAEQARLAKQFEAMQGTS